jgi:ornithine decarboxylase
VRFVGLGPRAGRRQAVFATLADEGIVLKMVNMGGGFPTRT